MKLQCSWCHKDLGYREPMNNRKTTHGICAKCLESRVYTFVRQVRLSQAKMPAPRPIRRLLLQK